MYENAFNSVAHKTNHMIKTWAEELGIHPMKISKLSGGT